MRCRIIGKASKYMRRLSHSCPKAQSINVLLTLLQHFLGACSECLYLLLVCVLPYLVSRIGIEEATEKESNNISSTRVKYRSSGVAGCSDPRLGWLSLARPERRSQCRQALIVHCLCTIRNVYKRRFGRAMKPIKAHRSRIHQI